MRLKARAVSVLSMQLGARAAAGIVFSDAHESLDGLAMRTLRDLFEARGPVADRAQHQAAVTPTP